MTAKIKSTKNPDSDNKKQFAIEGVSSVCALLSSIIVLAMVFFKKLLSINLVQSETVTVFELPDIIDSFRRMIEKLNLGDSAEVKKIFNDLDLVSTVFVVLSVATAILLILHIIFLIFGRGKWIRSTVITASVLYISLIVALYMFADKVSESVAEIDFVFFSLSNVVSVENTVFYILIPLGAGIVSSFVYAHYKKKN